MATFTYTPNGNLRLGFSGTAESLGNISRLFDYNVDSINLFTATDFTFGGDGLSAVTSTEDYGAVTDFNGPVEDLGEVAQYAQSTIVPFGSVLSVLQSQTQELNIFSVDFVTGTRDSEVGVSTTSQLKDYCNSIGAGNFITGKYGTLDDTAFAYINDASGLTWINYVISNVSDGDHHYINFDSGVAQIWSSEYVYKGQISSFDELTEPYTWAIFINLGGETGAVFKLPDYVATSTDGDLGNINLSRASFKVPQTTLSGNDGTLYFIPSLAGTGLFDIVNGYSPKEFYPWIPPGGSIYEIIGLESWTSTHNAPILFTQALDDPSGGGNQATWLQDYVTDIQSNGANATATLTTVATGGHNAFTTDSTLQSAIRTAIGSSNPSGVIANTQRTIIPSDNQSADIDGINYPVMGKLYVPTGLASSQIDVVVVFHGTVSGVGTDTIADASVTSLNYFLDQSNLNVRDKIIFSAAYPQDHISNTRQYDLPGVGTETSTFLMGDNLPYARAAVKWVQNSLDAYIATQGGSKTIGDVYLFGHSQGGKLVSKINTLDTGIIGVVANAPGPIQLDQTCTAQPGNPTCSKISAIYGNPPGFVSTGIGRTFAFSKGNYSGSGSLYGLSGLSESFTASYNESSIKIFTESDIGSITQPPVQDDPDFGDWGYVAAAPTGQLDFEQLVGFGFTESVYPLAGTGSTNPLSYGVALTLSGTAPSREIQVYGINPGDHLYPQPLDVSSGIITVSGTPLVHPFVDYTPHYGIEKNIGIGTYAFRLSDTADADKINDYVGSGNIPLLSGAAESITKVYDEYDVVIVDEVSYDGILDTVPYNGYEDWGQISELYTPSEVWGPIIGFGSFIPSFPAQTTYPFGLFNIVNGLSPQESYPWLPEPGVGRSWSFSKGLYTASGGISVVGVGTEVVYYEPLKVYGVDFVTGWVDSGVDSDNWSDQFRFYCNYSGFGNPVNGQYITNNNYAVAYIANVSGQNLLNQFIANATDGQRDYVNFGSGPAAKWSSAYKLSTTVVNSLEEIVDEYSYAPFEIAGQAGIAFKLPDYVPFGTGSLGDINKLYESFRVSGELNHPDIDLTPHYGIEKNIGIGTTGIQIGGISAGIERVIFNPPENTQLFEFVGIVTAEKRVVFNPPENIQLFESSGYITEKVAFNYVGIGSIPVTGTAIEKVRFDTPENTQLFDVSGIGSTKEIQVYGINPGDHLYPQPADFSGGLITIYGELNHPDIDYTPHYGIEKNIGIGTTGIQFKVGVGTNPDSEGRTRDARTYSNRYPINDKVPGTGIGTFLFDQINDTAKYGVLTPYAGLGTFYVSTGFSPEESYPWLPEPGVGRSWSYTRSTYITSGTLFTPASAITQEIQVYTFDTTPDVGVLTLSETFVERASNSYVGSGSYVVGRSRLHFDSNGQTFDQLYPTFDVDRSVEFIEYGAYYTETDAYAGSGTIRGLSGTAEAFSAQTPEDTQLFSVGGSANEAYSAQTPELEVLYSFQGSDTTESITVSLVGITAQIIASGVAFIQFEPNYAGRGTIRFVTHTTDNDYDTCDQEIFTTDYVSNANYSFTVNPQENTILFNFNGNADSTPSGIDVYEGVSTDITISGGASDFKRTFGYSGSGTILATSTSADSEVEIYTGSGSIAASGYSSENFTAQPTEDTVTYTFSGTASTEIDQVYPVSGIGLFNLSSSAQTREISTFSWTTNVLLGTITLSGELVFPDVRFIPSPETGGNINILGDAGKVLSKRYESSAGTLFEFGGGFESFTKSTYTGIGTVYFETQSATTTNNPFEIPRTYVVII